MRPFVVVAVKKSVNGISHVKLDSGSILTQNDCEELINTGATFITHDGDGNYSNVVVIESNGIRHLRTVRNSVESDNLNNLPLFE